MSIIDNLNDRVSLEQAANHFNDLLEKAKADVASYEATVKLIADKIKGLASEVVDVVEETVEAAKEEVKKSAPKRTTKKAAAKAEEKVEEAEKSDK